MMLKDKSGREVFGSGSCVNLSGLFVFNGANLEEVEEAIICKGKSSCPPDDFCKQVFADAGFEGIEYRINPKCYPYVDAGTIHKKEVRSNWSPILYWDTYKTYKDVEINELDGPNLDRAIVKIKQLLVLNTDENRFEKIFSVIGLGKTVTAQSLNRSCAVGENRPRFIVGDTVKTIGSESKTGVIRKIGKTASIVSPDGTTFTSSYEKLERDDTALESGLEQLSNTIAENFKYALENSQPRIYKAVIENCDILFPIFVRQTGGSQRECKGVNTCTCPVCSWKMVHLERGDSYECGYCSLVGKILQETKDEVVLLLDKLPGKNSFAIEEARCCSNCGLFHFDTGRQGKRSTGYCRRANHCVQAHTTCKMWTPRGLHSFDSNLKQHITNLRYGVNDSRNLNRNDITDTIYTAEDHKLEILRAEKLKTAYLYEYKKYLEGLVKMADGMVACDSISAEDSQKWMDKLKDFC